MMNNVNTQTIKESSNGVVLVKSIIGIGDFELRPIDLDNDLSYIHHWVNLEYAIYWGMNGFSLDEVKAAYIKILEQTQVYIGLWNGAVTFLLECYDPSQDVIAHYYPVKKGDRGMHILVAPVEKPIKNFTWWIFTTIIDFIFSDTTIDRIVVEPDARNHKIHLLNKKAGFVFNRFLELPHKKARLEFCSRENYQNAMKTIE